MYGAGRASQFVRDCLGERCPDILTDFHLARKRLDRTVWRNVKPRGHVLREFLLPGSTAAASRFLPGDFDVQCEKHNQAAADRLQEPTAVGARRQTLL